MGYFLVAGCAVLGLIVGSFLNVVISRVPAGGSVVRPRSRCPACAAPISARDNVPILSWLVLGRRCRQCGIPIPARYPLVEAGTGAVFAALAVRFGWQAALPAFLYLAAVGVALAAIDLEVRRLPDPLTLPAYLVGGALLSAAALLDGHPIAILHALVGMVAGYLVYLLLGLSYRGGMGFGDVKLAGVLGLYLGWLGWRAWAVGVLAGFLLGGLVAVVLLVAGRANRRTALPFGPFMLAGALLAVLFGTPIAHVWLPATG